MATLLEAHTGEWTSADLDLLPDHWKVELLDGTLIVNAQAMPGHIVAARRLVRLLEDSLGEDHELLPEVMVDLAGAHFAPDIAVAHRDRIDWNATEQDPATFALVVEVASPSTAAFDRTIKAERYAAAGIPGYWRVELDPITVIAHALRGRTYAELGRWGAGETVEVDEPVRVSFDPAVLLP
ncbi:Uma2 family endonuclease [Nocardioides sp. Root190]|uniref:Uma2 family endonuclease n=1 Tax=Nocardioides sp. Root190 TaxID=1736488 RepID=UPI000A90486F|nr:Uma2 family endonuclease [Nocardioides sp. Root190]